MVYADGFAVAGLLPVVAPCGEVVGGLAGEGGMLGVQLGVQLVKVLEADVDVSFGQPCEIAHEIVQRVGVGAVLGEGEGLGEAVGKGGGAGEVAQADGYGEAVEGGEGGLGKVGHGWRALEEVLMVILKSLYIGEQKRQPEKSQQKINGICIKTDAVYFNNELRRFMPFCFNRQAH